jgi:hypothetical protein
VLLSTSPGSAERTRTIAPDGSGRHRWTHEHRNDQKLAKAQRVPPSIKNIFYRPSAKLLIFFPQRSLCLYLL